MVDTDTDGRYRHRWSIQTQMVDTAIYRTARSLEKYYYVTLLYLFPSQSFFLLGFGLQGFTGDRSKTGQKIGIVDGRDDL